MILGTDRGQCRGEAGTTVLTSCIVRRRRRQCTVGLDFVVHSTENLSKMVPADAPCGTPPSDTHTHTHNQAESFTHMKFLTGSIPAHFLQVSRPIGQPPAGECSAAARTAWQQHQHRGLRHTTHSKGGLRGHCCALDSWWMGGTLFAAELICLSQTA